MHHGHKGWVARWKKNKLQWTMVSAHFILRIATSMGESGGDVQNKMDTFLHGFNRVLNARLEGPALSPAGLSLLVEYILRWNHSGRVGLSKHVMSLDFVNQSHQDDG